METLLHDVRYGSRQLVKHPVFTILAVVSLALGIGANTAIFSLVNAVLLRPLPVKESSRLVEVYGALNNGADFTLQSYVNYKDYRDRNDVFSGLFVYRIVVRSLSPHGSNERVWGFSFSESSLVISIPKAATNASGDFSLPEIILMCSGSNQCSAALFFRRK